MKSLAFPEIFKGVNTFTISDHEATSSNYRLLMGSERGTLYGDPYFGCGMKQVIQNQNGVVLQDIIIDEVYTTTLTFMPQLTLERKNITMENSENNLKLNISCTNTLDYVTDLYTFRLTQEEN